MCDLAQTYHIYQYRQLPPLEVAIFVMGLPKDSRLKKVLANQKMTDTEQLLAGIFDRLSILVWAKTKDGQRNRNRPRLILNSIQEDEEEVVGFVSGKEFEQARKQIVDLAERR